jgi:alcohol dehydrogenase
LKRLVLELTAGMGADVVVEATGQNELLDAAAGLARPLGTVCLKSTSGLPARELNTTLHTVNELRFQGSRCGPFDKAIQFLLDHNLPDRTWITSVHPLSQVQQALQEAETVPKVILNISQ